MLAKHVTKMSLSIRLHKKLLFALCIIIVTAVFLMLQIQTMQYEIIVEEIPLGQQEHTSVEIQKWWLQRNTTKNLSKLGRVLFLSEPEPRVEDSAKKFQILLWKYGKTIESRHLKHFGDKKSDPFAHCSVKNCDITYNDQAITTADIVIFHLHRLQGLSDLPKQRKNDQIWAFLTDESPFHTFLKGKVKLSDFNGKFNWSMTYRMDSDIPVPYGRTIVENRQTSELTLNKRRDVLLAVLASNCGGKNHRWDYIRELQKHISVDVYGKCGNLKTCPGHFKKDCTDIEKYLFYLSFENSNCDEYITEKLWWNAFEKNSIPIVMGATKSDYEKLLPPNSYINVEDFSSPYSLAQFILRLNNTGEFQGYFKWKNNFRVLNEHGYFQSESYHYCRVCQALNYNSKKEKVYNKLEEFWSTKANCYPAWDEW